MKRNKIFLMLILIYTVCLNAQQIGKGSPDEIKFGIHDGNRVKTVFSNWGVIAQPGDFGPAGGWIYSTNKYVGDVSPLVGVSLPIKDYNLDGKIDTLYSVIVTDVSGHGSETRDYSPGNTKPWTFEPIPGFSNPLVSKNGQGIAMSNLPNTWPLYWPDQPTWKNENGNVEWNGYFGRGQINADQESYFMMDDNCDEKMFSNYGFLPDSTDPTRKGQALRVAVRGLQWSDFLAQDVIFWLYEIKNIGTTTYKEAVFGALVGTYVGLPGDEYLDDCSFFNIRENITYSWDFDHYVNPAANPAWQGSRHDVGYVAYSYLESPGNRYDGIDNDGDSKDNEPLFTENDFQPKVLNAGQKLILIDKDYKRSEFIMPNYPVDVESLGRTFHLVPDSTILAEGNMENSGLLNINSYDGIDNDFDGLIDENYQIHFRQLKKDNITKKTLIDTLNPVKYIDYLSGLNQASKMIDEGRDDGIDNDGDWSKDINSGSYLFDENGNLIDDVGKDGKKNSGDEGENDGIPTVGEPNFDKTDVDESDQIGLTSFHYFVPANDIRLNDDNDLWRRMRPGLFDVPSSVQSNVATKGEDGDFMYGSGYFPLLPGSTERFSLAFSFGVDYNAIIKTKRIAQIIYDANYNFPKPPEKPTLKVAAGDGKVILYWDKVAESSIDPSTREKDFEGYLIYKSTDPNFNDIMTITDKDGNPQRLKPIQQYDLADGIRGTFIPNKDLLELRKGVPFYLGDDTGIKNTYVDEDVKNGVTYFYAVCAYDKGLAERNIFPAENSHYITTDILGNYYTDINCAVVVPNAQTAGYMPPENGERLIRKSGKSKTIPSFSIIDPTKVKNAEYEVNFIDSLQSGIPIAYAYSVKNKTTGEIIYKKNSHFQPDNNDVFDGVTLYFDTRYQNSDSVKADVQMSMWNNPAGRNLRFSVQPFNFTGYPKGVRETEIYAIVFSDLYNKKSADRLLKLSLPSRNTNFEIFKIVNPQNPVKIPFAFVTTDSILNKGDRIMMATSDTTSFTWAIEFTGDSTKIPTGGDTLYISIINPISSSDVFTFQTKAAYVDPESAAEQINKIKVVPNPYVVTNIYEHPLPGDTRGRGERAIHFNHVPVNCKISIYTSRGNLVRSIHHEGNLNDGSVSWDLRSEEGLDVAYGVYFYIAEDPVSGVKKTGKIALIK